MPELSKADQDWQDWVALCQSKWDAAAAELVSQGYTRHDHDVGLVSTTFHKDGRVMYLYRMLGFTEWYPAEMDWRVS